MRATIHAETETVAHANFGPLIAYLVPGATALISVAQFVPTIARRFSASGEQSPTNGGFLYLTIASNAAGMIVSTIRWAVVDWLHALTGVPAPKLDFSRLGHKSVAMAAISE